MASVRHIRGVEPIRWRLRPAKLVVEDISVMLHRCSSRISVISKGIRIGNRIHHGRAIPVAACQCTSSSMSAFGYGRRD